MRILFFLLGLVASPVVAQRSFDLSPEALAFCLDQNAELARLNGEIESVTARRAELFRIGQELRLRQRSLRDTARLDARVATRFRALQLEQERLLKAQEAAALQLDENLIARQDVERNFERVCAGRTYNMDDLAIAQEIRKAQREGVRP